MGAVSVVEGSKDVVSIGRSISSDSVAMLYSAVNTNQLNNQVANLQAQANNVQAGIRSLQRSTNVAQARADEVGAVADYVLSSGTKCGPQTVTGWTERVDYFRDVKVISTTKQFIAGTGIFTPQHVGYYQNCTYSRFQLGGNAVEMCIR